MSTPNQPVAVLRHKELLRRVGLSRQHILRMEKAGNFPKRFSLGPNTVAWVEAEIEAWLQQQIAKRDLTPSS